MVATFIEKKVEDVKAAELKEWYPEGHVKDTRSDVPLVNLIPPITEKNKTRNRSGNCFLIFSDLISRD